MSLEAILAAIEASGEAEVARLRADAESRTRQMLDEAERRAAVVREEARRAALRPAAGERARRLHQAKLDALRTVGEIRNRLVESVLAETQPRLAHLCADSDYPLILRRLIEEAIRVLGAEESDSSRSLLEADPRDEILIHHILDDLDLDVPVVPSLDCWGGVVARSADRRVVATNTLEARLERATSFLRQDLAAFLEKELKDSRERQELTQCAVG